MFWLRASSSVLLLVLSGHSLAAAALQTDYYQSLAFLRTHELFFEAAPQWAIGINLVAATILFFLWGNQRNVPHVNWLLGACLTSNVTNLNTLFPDLLHPLLIDFLLGAWLYCLTRIIFTRPTSSALRWIGAIAVFLLINLVMARILGGQYAHTVLLSAALCLLTLTAGINLLLQIRAPRNPKISLLAGVFILGLSGMLDTISGLLHWQLERQLLLSPFAQMIAVILALYFLVARHANNQHQLSLLNATLDIRVRDAERELEERYRQLTREAVDTAALRERRKIYQSIHEDLSDKLLQLIYRAPAPETADLARAALAELRDTQKLRPDEQRVLPHILADALVEVQSRCDQVNLQLSWFVAPQLDDFSLNARQESALTRTLREAISNLFKHAHAREVIIDFSLSETVPHCLHYTVSDDGKGIDPARPPGRGLNNMQQRLEEHGGGVSIRSTTNGGTTLFFTLPFSSVQS